MGLYTYIEKQYYYYYYYSYISIDMVRVYIRPDETKDGTAAYILSRLVEEERYQGFYRRNNNTEVYTHTHTRI